MIVIVLCIIGYLILSVIENCMFESGYEKAMGIRLERWKCIQWEDSDGND